MTKEPTPWRPTQPQAAFLQAALESGKNRNISAIAKAAGVSRDSVYNWFRRDPEFKSAWENLWPQIVARHLPAVVAGVVAEAQKGDSACAKLVFQLAGILKDRLDVNVNVDRAGELKAARERARKR